MCSVAVKDGVIKKGACITNSIGTVKAINDMVLVDN